MYPVEHSRFVHHHLYRFSYSKWLKLHLNALTFLLHEIADILKYQLHNLDSADLIDFIGLSSCDILYIVRVAVDELAKIS